jgi:sugar phosphate isomerase/epimerase
MGVKFSICNELFEGWPIEDVFRTAAEIGYDGVEIAPFTLAESVCDVTHEQRREIVQLAKNNGIEIVGLHWVLVKPPGLYLNHPDEAIRKRTRDYLDALIRFCADLGGKVVVFGSPKQRSVHEELTFQQAWDYALETFVHISETARQEGVYFCIEPLSPKETDFINTMADALRMVREVNNPYFQTMIDVKALTSEGRPLPEIIREGRECIRHVHANEPDGRGPGTGNTDFHQISVALEEIGYCGYVSVEVFDFKPDPILIAKNSLAHLKKAFVK